MQHPLNSSNKQGLSATAVPFSPVPADNAPPSADNVVPQTPQSTLQLSSKPFNPSPNPMLPFMNAMAPAFTPALPSDQSGLVFSGGNAAPSFEPTGNQWHQSLDSNGLGGDDLADSVLHGDDDLLTPAPIVDPIDGYARHLAVMGGLPSPVPPPGAKSLPSLFGNLATGKSVSTPGPFQTGDISAPLPTTQGGAATASAQAGPNKFQFHYNQSTLMGSGNSLPLNDFYRAAEVLKKELLAACTALDAPPAPGFTPSTFVSKRDISTKATLIRHIDAAVSSPPTQAPTSALQKAHVLLKENMEMVQHLAISQSAVLPSACFQSCYYLPRRLTSAAGGALHSLPQPPSTSVAGGAEMDALLAGLHPLCNAPGDETAREVRMLTRSLRVASQPKVYAALALDAGIPSLRSRSTIPAPLSVTLTRYDAFLPSNIDWVLQAVDVWGASGASRLPPHPCISQIRGAFLSPEFSREYLMGVERSLVAGATGLNLSPNVASSALDPQQAAFDAAVLPLEVTALMERRAPMWSLVFVHADAPSSVTLSRKHVQNYLDDIHLDKESAEKLDEDQFADEITRRLQASPCLQLAHMQTEFKNYKLGVFDAGALAKPVARYSAPPPVSTTLPTGASSAAQPGGRKGSVVSLNPSSAPLGSPPSGPTPTTPTNVERTSAAHFWAYAAQLVLAIKHVHQNGLAFRCIAANRVSVGYRTRVRVLFAGIEDALSPLTTAEEIEAEQRRDLIDLGVLLLEILLGVSFGGREFAARILSANEDTDWDMQQKVSFPDHTGDKFAAALSSLLQSVPAEAADLISTLLFERDLKAASAVGTIFREASGEVERLLVMGDEAQVECMKSANNGRLFRLLAKIILVADRAVGPDGQNNQWAETHSRYVVRLFRDYLITQQEVLVRQNPPTGGAGAQLGTNTNSGAAGASTPDGTNGPATSPAARGDDRKKGSGASSRLAGTKGAARDGKGGVSGGDGSRIGANANNVFASSPVLDLNFIIDTLNKLDVGSNERLALSSPDSKAVLLLSFAAIRKALDSSFAELTTAASESVAAYHQHIVATNANAPIYPTPLPFASASAVPTLDSVVNATGGVTHSRNVVGGGHGEIPIFLPGDLTSNQTPSLSGLPPTGLAGGSGIPFFLPGQQQSPTSPTNASASNGSFPSLSSILVQHPSHHGLVHAGGPAAFTPNGNPLVPTRHEAAAGGLAGIVSPEAFLAPGATPESIVSSWASIANGRLMQQQQLQNYSLTQNNSSGALSFAGAPKQSTVSVAGASLGQAAGNAPSGFIGFDPSVIAPLVGPQASTASANGSYRSHMQHMSMIHSHAGMGIHQPFAAHGGALPFDNIPPLPHLMGAAPPPGLASPFTRHPSATNAAATPAAQPSATSKPTGGSSSVPDASAKPFIPTGTVTGLSGTSGGGGGGVNVHAPAFMPSAIPSFYPSNLGTEFTPTTSGAGGLGGSTATPAPTDSKTAASGSATASGNAARAGASAASKGTTGTSSAGRGSVGGGSRGVGGNPQGRGGPVGSSGSLGSSGLNSSNKRR